MNLSPELLISVKSATEFDRLTSAKTGSVGPDADIVVADFPVADIVDLKDPQSGPLAPASAQLWHHAATVAMPEIRISAALGEFDQAIDVAADLPHRFDYAKMGPSGQSTTAELLQAWKRVREALPISVELVAVAYADHLAAGTMPVDEIFAIARQAGFKRVLVDTFVKDGRSSREHLGQSELERLIQQARDSDTWFALAGSLCLSDAPWLTSDHGPQCIGLRGAVCDGDRTNTLSLERCMEWRGLLENSCDQQHRLIPNPAP